jgi:hypothetical protein
MLMALVPAHYHNSRRNARAVTMALGQITNNSRLSSSSCHFGICDNAVALGPLPKDLGWRLEAASQLQISCRWENIL